MTSLPKVLLPRAALRCIETQAEAAYPQECCGLLVGTRNAASVTISCAEASANVAGETAGVDARRRFEVDPALSLKLHKSLRHSDQRLVGVFHSHPEGPAKPSAHDLSRAWQPELAWLVTAVAKGRAGATGAFFLSTDTKPRFVELELAVVDDENGSKA